MPEGNSGSSGPEEEYAQRDRLFALYLAHFCYFRPFEVLEELKRRNDYKLEDALDIVTRFEILDAQAYL